MKTNRDAAEWLKVSSLPFWEVRNDSDKNVGRSPETTENKTPSLEESINKFLEVTALLPQGNYSLYAWRFATGKQAGLEFIFFVGNANHAQQPQAQIGNTHSPEVELLRKKLEDMERKQWEKEIEEKYRRKYANPKKEDGMNKFIGIISKIHDMWNGQKTKTANVGNPEPQTEEEQQATAQEVEQALTTLQEKLGTETLVKALNGLASKPAEQLQNLLKFL